MVEINDILSQVNHRPFTIPNGKWAYYQEWNNALFLHWKVSYEVLRKLVPQDLNLDTHNGSAYISLVAFTMQKIRPRYFPAIRSISNFYEINIRTYIDNDSKKGVYFLSIEAQKYLSVFIAKALSDLPYRKSNIQRVDCLYRSTNNFNNFFLDTEFEIKQPLIQKTALDKWLTERYCLYFDKGNTIYRYDIHHKEWDLKNIDIKRLNLNYKMHGIALTDQPELAHYSNGVKVLAWKKTKIL